MLYAQGEGMCLYSKKEVVMDSFCDGTVKRKLTIKMWKVWMFKSAFSFCQGNNDTRHVICYSIQWFIFIIYTEKASDYMSLQIKNYWYFLPRPMLTSNRCMFLCRFFKWNEPLTEKIGHWHQSLHVKEEKKMCVGVQNGVSSAGHWEGWTLNAFCKPVTVCVSTHDADTVLHASLWSPLFINSFMSTLHKPWLIFFFSGLVCKFC